MPAKKGPFAHNGLIALHAPVKLEANGDLPPRLLMLKWGDNETTQGKVRVGKKTLATFQATHGQEDLGYGDVVIDFNHNTVPGHPSYKGEPAAVAARRATPKVIEGEGLVFDDIDWTEDAQKHREHYPDLSPAVKTDDDGEVIFIHSGALARNGSVKDLHLFSADSVPASVRSFLKQTNPSMKIKTFAVNTDLLKQILKLDSSASDDDVNKALAALAAGGDDASNTSVAPVEKKGTAKPTGDGSESQEEKIAALTAQVGELKNGLLTLTAFQVNSARDQIVAEATKAGKVVPKEWLPGEDGKGGIPVEQLRTLCATLPEVVPLERRTPEGIKTFTALPVNTAEREVMKVLNIPEETWKKHDRAA